MAVSSGTPAILAYRPLNLAFRFGFGFRGLAAVLLNRESRNPATVGIDASQVFDDIGFDLERFDARGRIGHEAMREMRRRFGREFVHSALALDRIQRLADITRFERGQSFRARPEFSGMRGAPPAR